MERTIPRLIKRVSTGSLLSAKEKQGLRAFFRKPRKLIALAIFLAMLSRAVWFYVREERLLGELMDAFDSGHDHRLTTSEMSALLGANGIDFSQEQVGKLFGRVDDEGDGYDEEEMSRIMRIVSSLPAVSERIQRVASASRSVYVDISLCVVSGAGLAYLVGQSDSLERKWAASSFRSAVHFRRMQHRCSQLDTQLAQLSSERERLEQEIKQVEQSSFADVEERKRELKRLGSRLQEVQQRQEDAKLQLEKEVAKWQGETEKCMREASLAKSKMERVMTCIKGIDAFTGTGTGNFATQGAQQGFSSVQSSRGFSLDTICFGTIENGQLLMFETAHTRKLGEGKDCAYRCTDLSTGRELALKMYKIANPKQRHAIHNDLYAHREQVGRHPRIVGYERVIESESTIFVLMELLAGQDLFDVVAGRGLSESEARGLFVELVEALQHLHKNHVIHCDVKPENAMVVGNIDAGVAHLKLIDFGCSCFIKYVAGESSGSVVYDAYMPPEHAERPDLAPAVATDMWRLGCTLYVMLVRRPPFHNDAQTPEGRAARKASQFFRTPEFEALSAEAKDLIGRLMAGEPAKRPTTAEVLEHAWVKAIDQGDAPTRTAT